MGLIKSFQAASIWGQVALICLLVAELFNWLCFCMNDWGRIDSDRADDDNKDGIGVWKRCGNQEIDANCADLDGWRVGWYGAFQAFVIIGFMGVNLAFLFLILTLFVPHCLGNREVAMASTVSSFVAALSYTISLIIFGVRFDKTFDMTFDRETYASGFYLAILIALLAIAAGVCGIMTAHGGKAVAQSSAHGNGQSETVTRQAQKK